MLHKYENELTLGREMSYSEYCAKDQWWLKNVRTSNIKKVNKA